MIQPKIFEDLSTTKHQTSFDKHHSKSIFLFEPICIAACILLFIFLRNIQAQENSLHLVKTITGIDEDNRIYSAKGIGDINNDDYDDFQVMLESCTNIYFGSADFDTIPEYTFMNSLVYPIGDVNNDGYSDLMISKTDYSVYPPLTTFNVYKGGKELDTVPIFTYRPPSLVDIMFTGKIETIGDLNGDGYKDFVISAYYNWSDGKGKVYIFCGGDTISDKPAKILTQENPVPGWDMNFGISVVGIGDINNDKYDDVLVYQDPHDPDSGKVYLYYGCADLDTMHSKLFPRDGQWFGADIQNTGDMNADGKEEFIIGSTTGTHIYFNEDSSIVNHLVKGWYGAGGDLNGDGYDDLLICTGETKISAVHGFFGGSEIDTLEDFVIYGEQPYSQFGGVGFEVGLNIAGDINGDGYDDVLITAPDFKNSNVQTGKVYIYSYKDISSVQTDNEVSKSELFSVKQNYPNPFNPATVISYRLSVMGSIKIRVYDILGKEIAQINEGIKPPGEYSFTFHSGKYNLTTGTYFIEFTAEPLSSHKNIYRKVIKTLLLK